MAVGEIPPNNGVNRSQLPSEGPKKTSPPEATVPNNVAVAQRVPLPTEQHPTAKILTAAMNQHKFEVKTGKGLSNLVLRIPIKNQSEEIGTVTKPILSAQAQQTSKKDSRHYSLNPESTTQITQVAMERIA